MNVLHVNMSVDPVGGGGTAERVCQLARHMAQAGVNCEILTLNLGLSDQRRRELAGVRITALPCLNRRFYVPARGLAAIRRCVAGADIVHVTGHWTLINLLAYRAAKADRRPYVVCPAGALAIFGRSSTLKRAYNLVAGRRLVADAHGHVAISTSEYHDYAGYGIQSHRLRLIPNGIDAAQFTTAGGAYFRRRTGVGDNPLVLFVGRLNPIKGPDVLLSAFEQIAGRLPDVHLCFVGPDEGLQASLTAMAQQAGLQARVHFAGYLGGRDKTAAYDAADLLVVPSRREAMSIVALEAGACATPVLLSDRCGFDAPAKVGGGDVVSPDPNAIAAALLRLLSDRRGLRAMGLRLQKHVWRHHTWNRAAAEHIDYFDEILKRSNRKGAVP